MGRKRRLIHKFFMKRKLQKIDEKLNRVCTVLTMLLMNNTRNELWSVI